MNSQRETEQGKWVSLDQQQSRMNEIENMVAGGFMTAPQCFTQMKQLIQAAWQAATEQGEGEVVKFTCHGNSVPECKPLARNLIVSCSACLKSPEDACPKYCGNGTVDHKNKTIMGDL